MTEILHVEVWARMRCVADAISTLSVVGERIPVHRLRLDQLYGVRASKLKERLYGQAAQVGREILERELNTSQTERSLRQHTKVVLALAFLVRNAASGSKAASGRGMVESLVKGLDLPSSITTYLRPSDRTIKARDLHSLAGLSVPEWHTLAAGVNILTMQHRKPLVERITSSDPEPLKLDVAQRLGRMAANEAAEAERSVPTYDVSGRALKLKRIEVTGFRGSAGCVSLELTRQGKPVDVLLWGDNGVGKSTLIDGIEFALQGRVDRSSDFNSSQRSAIRNFTVNEASVVVDLSDGTQSARSMHTNDQGRNIASTREVSAGFRISPVVIRRADILRFLDTEGVARGTVFFDYFPEPGKSLGSRPDEELRELEEEYSALRVVRADLALQLTKRYKGSTNLDLTDARNLDLFVAQLVEQSGLPPNADPAGSLNEDVLQLIGNLRSAQRRTSAIKKKLALGVQRFNPVAYDAQLARIAPAIRAVGNDLTRSFKEITRADHVVSLTVLLAKSGPVSLDVVVEFDNGAFALAQQAFSEGFKDLIALLFFLAMTKKAGDMGQAKVLVLDDALQSVDSSVRVGVMDHILDNFRDWQLIVTGHDRAWLTQLKGLYQRRGKPMVERTISRWSFSEGIEVSGESRVRADAVRSAVTQCDIRMTAAATGLLLEEICQELNWRLETSVTRRPGDRYTIGDMWPGIGKALKATPLAVIVHSINLRIEIRNLLGAHFNDDADTIPWSDVRALAEDVMALYRGTHCEHCGGWIAKIKQGCPCGTLLYASARTN